MITIDDILKLIPKKISTDEQKFAYPNNNTPDETWFDIAEKVAELSHTKELNINTYKRMYKILLKDTGMPYATSKKTLYVLTQLFGYDSWEELDAHIDEVRADLENENRKNDGISTFVPVDLRNVLMLSNMRKGQLLRVKYRPDREIEMECIGRNRFRVVNAKNSSLKRNFTFTAKELPVGELFHVEKIEDPNGNKLGKYIAGKGHTISEVSKPITVDGKKLVEG